MRDSCEISHGYVLYEVHSFASYFLILKCGVNKWLLSSTLGGKMCNQKVICKLRKEERGEVSAETFPGWEQVVF